MIEPPAPGKSLTIGERTVFHHVCSCCPETGSQTHSFEVREGEKMVQLSHSWAALCAQNGWEKTAPIPPASRDPVVRERNACLKIVEDAASRWIELGGKRPKAARQLVRDALEHVADQIRNRSTLKGTP